MIYAHEITREMQIYRNSLISTLVRNESDDYLKELFAKNIQLALAEVYEEIEETSYTENELNYLESLNAC
jgi:hypothetical protein